LRCYGFYEVISRYCECVILIEILGVSGVLIVDAWDEFCCECRSRGGVPEPLPCEWYNDYCEDVDECVYCGEPLMVDEEHGFYCCRSAVK